MDSPVKQSDENRSNNEQDTKDTPSDVPGRSLHRVHPNFRARGGHSLIHRPKTDEVKKNEETLEETKPPVKKEPKPFIKATKSRWRPGELEEMRKDDSSYTNNLVSPEMQASKEPDFIGDAFYYNLSNPMIVPQLQGDYVILYTRPVGAVFDVVNNSALVSPNIANRISIYTHRAQPRSGAEELMQECLSTGAWAAGHIVFQGLEAAIICQGMPDGTRNTTHAFMTSDTDPLEYVDNPLFNSVIQETGSSLSFGLKVMESKRGQTRKVVHSGFYFVKLEISRFDDRSGEIGRQLVVAVKVPGARLDVASAFILKQNCFSPRDISILNWDIGARGLADWRVYAVTAVTEGGHDSRPDPEWVAPHPSQLGFYRKSFLVNIFEEYLYTIDDPVQELVNLVACVDGVANPPAGQVDALNKASRYINYRHKVMRGELELRRSVGAEKLALASKAEPKDAHSLRGKQDIVRGSGSRQEPRGMFGEIVNRGP